MVPASSFFSGLWELGTVKNVFFPSKIMFGIFVISCNDVHNDFCSLRSLSIWDLWNFFSFNLIVRPESVVSCDGALEEG